MWITKRNFHFLRQQPTLHVLSLLFKPFDANSPQSTVATMFLGETPLPPSVKMFVDVLIGFHLAVLAFFVFKVSLEFVMPTKRKNE